MFERFKILVFSEEKTRKRLERERRWSKNWKWRFHGFEVQWKRSLSLTLLLYKELAFYLLLLLPLDPSLGTLSLSLSWNLFFIYFGRFGLVKCCWGLLHMIELVIDVNLLLVCGKCCVLCWKLWVWLIATIGQFFYFILMFCKFYLVNFCAAASFGID